MRLRPDTWETGGLENHSWILAKIQNVPDLDQHSCRNRTVYGLFRSEDSRCRATPLLRDCVRVNSFGTGSQHIPDLEQHPYHMLVNSFVRFDNPHLKQQRFQGTAFVSLRITTICFFSALPSSFSTWRRLHLILRVTFIRTGDTINLIYTNDTYVYFPIRSMGAGKALVYIYCPTFTFQLLDKLWSQVSSLPPGTWIQFFYRA